MLARPRQPWAQCFPCPEANVAPLSGQGGEVGSAALEALAAGPGARRLADVLADETRDRYLRRHALRLLGVAGEGEHIDLVLAVAAGDPFFYGETALACLRDLVRRGVPCRAIPLEAVFDLFPRCPALSAGDTAEVVGPRWPQWLEALAALPAQDPSWPRQVALLERADCPATSAYLLSLLDREEFVPLFGDVMRALGRLGYREAGPRILALLDQVHEAAGFALERIGGGPTCSALLGRLYEPPSGCFPRAEAARLLFALAEAPGPILDLISADELGPQHLTRLAAPADEPTLDALADIAHRPRHTARLRALEQLGHVGGATALPALHDLLADGDEEVRAAARAAARAIGRRLHEHQEDRRRGAEARRRPFRRAGRPALAGHARQPGIA